MSPPRNDDLERDIRARLADVCSDWPEDDLQQLVSDIADIKLRYLLDATRPIVSDNRRSLAGLLGAVPHARRQTSVPRRTIPENEADSR